MLNNEITSKFVIRVYHNGDATFKEYPMEATTPGAARSEYDANEWGAYTGDTVEIAELWETLADGEARYEAIYTKTAHRDQWHPTLANSYRKA